MNKQKSIKIIFSFFFQIFFIFFLVVTLFALLFSGISYAKPEQIKIAVIPFSNLSEKQEYNWIGSGFAETMISALTNVGNIQITERFLMNEVLKEVALQQTGFIDEKSSVRIGKLTGANVIISGSFQILNNEIVINARFINIEKGTVEEGSALYLRGKLSNLFDLQETLAYSFNEKFKIVMTKQEETNVKKVIYSTKSIEANKLYLQARKRYENGGYKGNKDAVELLKKALELDPNYALAWALLGNVNIAYSSTQGYLHDFLQTGDDYEKLYEEGIVCLKKAISLFPDSYEIYRSLGSGFYRAGKKAETEKYLNKALELKPDDVESILLMGLVKNTLPEAVNKAMVIDPYNYEIYFTLGKYYLYLVKDKTPENLQLAVSNLRKAVELNPYSWGANMQLVQAYMRQHDFENAVGWAERMIKMERDVISYIIATSAYMGARNMPKMREMYIEIDKEIESSYVKTIIAATYLGEKNYQKAYSVTRNALKKYPDDPGLNNVMAMIYLEHFHNCKYAIYHYEIFLKNFEKMPFFTKENKKEAQEKYESIKKDCGK